MSEDKSPIFERKGLFSTDISDTNRNTPTDTDMDSVYTLQPPQNPHFEQQLPQSPTETNTPIFNWAQYWSIDTVRSNTSILNTSTIRSNTPTLDRNTPSSRSNTPIMGKKTYKKDKNKGKNIISKNENIKNPILSALQDIPGIEFTAEELAVFERNKDVVL